MLVSLTRKFISACTTAVAVTGQNFVYAYNDFVGRLINIDLAPKHWPLITGVLRSCLPCF